MTRFFTRSKIRLLVIFCLVCLFLGLTTVKHTVIAKEKSPYFIKVNKQQNCITIYEKDKDGNYTVPVKAMACSTGPATPLGTYNTLIKYRWKLLMGDVWGQYSTRIVKGILFHSVWYYEMKETTLSAKQYNKLGSSASHGCIRVTVEDAKWIYDNCPVGTTVEIYNGKDPGPLGKPETIKLKAGTGWDPTDPSKDNPYNGKTPNIKGAKNMTIKWGAQTDFLKGVSATSTTGTDITSKLKIEGNVDIYTAGKYKLKYIAMDALNRTKEKTVTITVKDCVEEPRFEGVVDRSVSRDTIVDREFALEGITPYMSSKVLDIEDVEVNISQDAVNIYSIEYKIVGENGLTGYAKATVHVDTNAPIIEGVAHKELTLEQLKLGKAEIQKIALKGITVKDGSSIIKTDKLKVSLKAISDYAYLVTYKVADNSGNIATETVQFTYFKSVRMDGISNHYNIPYDTAITEEYVKQGITASNSEGDITNEISVEIINTTEGLYKVTYLVPDEDGVIISVVAYFTVEKESIIAEDSITVEDSIIVEDVKEIKETIGTEIDTERTDTIDN